MTTVQHANFIQYGRRAGKAKLDKKKPNSTKKFSVEEQSEHVGPVGFMRADGTDLRQVKVLPRNEWERIQHSIHAKEEEKERMSLLREEREEKHAQSKNVVKNWSNTIAGQRQKKLEARKVREEIEEEKRVKLDVEEAKYQAAKRKEAIEKAKTVQYFQTDRIKSFHGALLLSEVLKERDAQVELKKQKEASLVGKDSELLKRYREEYEKGIRSDQILAAQRYQERKKVSDYQQMQAKEHEAQHDKEVLEDKREGEELRKLAKLHEWEEKQLEETRRSEKIEIMRSHKNHTQNKAAIRALEEQQEEEENDEIRLFAAAKKRMQKLRKEKEANLFKEVQDHKDKMIHHLSSQLKQKVDNEDERIQKATEEKEQKLLKVQEEKQTKLKRDLSAIAKHRNEQLLLKEQQERAERQNALETLQLKLEADHSFARSQAEKRIVEKKNKKELQGFHMQQVNTRAEKERQGREEDLVHDEKLVDLVAIEENQFQKYAGQVIKDAKDRGYNTYPLVKAAQAGAGGGRGPQFEGKGGIRPSYLTTDGYGVQLPYNQRSSTKSIKSKCEVGEASVAKKRLGFVW